MKRIALFGLLAGAIGSSALAVGCSKGTNDAPSSGSDAVSADDAAPLMPIEDMIARAKTRDYWPSAADDWRALPADAQQTLMSSPACQDFAAFMFPSADADAKNAAALGTTVDKLTNEQQAPRTDGAIVVKNGDIVYENYVGPYAGHPERRHCMWSSSKSFTTGIVGALAMSSELTKSGQNAAAGKLTISGQPIGLSTPLSDLADMTQLNADPRLGNMTIEDVLSMNIPNPVWDEGYDGNISTSDVVKMLWLDGQRDMAKFASNTLFGPASATPMTAFSYSSGNAVILLRALKELYGADYDRLPWTALFDRLGMQSVVFERDPQGVFVGSSYAHMTLRDMARFGYAYLNGGYFDGEQVIHPDFVQKARVLGAGMSSPGTTDDSILVEGSFYSMGFWINPNPRVLESQGTKQFGANFPVAPPGTSYGGTAVNNLQAGSKFFPNSPVDVIIAAGHYGQNIMIFPKDDLMIVRMSHDAEYFSKLDRFMSKARACFLTN